MNWRRILFLYTAQVLDQIRETNLARQLRSLDVPAIDGGGFQIMTHQRGSPSNLYELSRWYQHFSTGGWIEREVSLKDVETATIVFPAVFLSISELQTVRRELAFPESFLENGR